MNELRVVCSHLTPAEVKEGDVCDDEDTSCAFTPPTIPAAPEGPVGHPWGQKISYFLRFLVGLCGGG
jgi:hypothetical protein